MKNEKSSTTSGGADNRVRNWMLIVWQESAPENWRDIISESCSKWFESPLHDMDFETNKDTGEAAPKKPHWHTLLMFATLKSYKQVKELLEKLGSDQAPKRCGSPEHSLRYMAHLDHPDKHQYAMSDIVGYGGARVENYIKLSKEELYDVFDDIRRFVKKHSIVHYNRLLEMAEETHPEWRAVIYSNGHNIDRILNSNWQELGGDKHDKR